jgi:TRAP-type uncharacterized transport system substrate-binding protein
VPTRALRFAGASIPGRGTPWGTLAELGKRALEPFGYEIEIETRSFMFNNARYVADGRCSVGFMNLTQLLHAYFGEDAFKDDGPHERLRLLALINHPTWLGVAVTESSGITDLAQVIEEKRPVKIRAAAGGMVPALFEHFGWSGDVLAAFGAKLLATHDREGGLAMEAAIVEPARATWAVDGDFDVIIDTVYAGFTPEIHHWHEASIYHDLKFLPLPESLVDRLVAGRFGTHGILPRRLLRGLWYDVAAVQRLPQVIYCRDDLDDEIVRDLVRALDANRQLFRSAHLAFSYDPENVAQGSGVPLHRAARAYYDEMGYPTP